MKKLLALMVAMVMVIGLAGFALALETHHPAKKDNDGRISKPGKSIAVMHVTDWISEGDTSDAWETTIGVVDPTADRAIDFPNASGKVALINDISSTMFLTNATMLIGNSGGLAAEQTLSMINDVTGILNASGVINTTIPASRINSSMIAANAVGNSETNRLITSLVIATAATSNVTGNNVAFNAAGYSLTPKTNANSNQFIANSTMDVNGNITVFLNGTADDDYTLEVVRWAP